MPRDQDSEERIMELVARYSAARATDDPLDLETTVFAAPEKDRAALLTELLLKEQELRLEQNLPPAMLSTLMQRHPTLTSYLEPAYAELPEGYLVVDRFGDYQTLKYVGKGSQGQAVQARHVASRKLVLIKYAADEEKHFRLQHEYEVIRQLPKRLVRAAIGEGTQRRYGRTWKYIVLEWVPGESVAERYENLSAQRNQAQRLDAAAASDIVRQAAVAVHRVHRHSIYHRDLKPHNLMEDQTGRIKIIDFGLAVVVDRSGHAKGPSREHAGTAEYMSPQQRAGSTDENLEASDIYSLGAILYFLLRGEHPREVFTDAQVTANDLNNPWQPPLLDLGNQPWLLRQICQKAMHLKEGDRYPSAKALARDLRLWSLSHRHWKLAAAAAAILVVVGVSGIFWAATALRNMSAVQLTHAEAGPSWQETLIDENNIGRITRDNFRVSIEPDAGSPRSMRASEVRLYVEAIGLHPDLLGGVEYRVGKRAWRPIYRSGPDGRAFVVLDKYDREIGGPIELQIDTEMGHKQGDIIGPFHYDLSIDEALADFKTHRKERFHAAAATDNWLTMGSAGWMLQNDFVDQHLRNVQGVWVGTDPDRLQLIYAQDEVYMNFSGVSFDSKSAVNAAAEHLRQLSYSRARDASHLYVQLRGFDGEKSEVKEFRGELPVATTPGSQLRISPIEGARRTDQSRSSGGGFGGW